MHERPEFDAADLTAMMARMAGIRSEVDDLLAAYVSRDSTRQAHLCELLSDSLDRSLDHLAHLCAPVRDEAAAHDHLNGGTGARPSPPAARRHAATVRPPAPAAAHHAPALAEA